MLAGDIVNESDEFFGFAGDTFEAAPISGDSLGWSVAISGDLAVAGAPKHDALGHDAGAAYLHKKTAQGSWEPMAKLQASTGATDANGIFRSSWIRGLVIGEYTAEIVKLDHAGYDWNHALDLPAADEDLDGLPEYLLAVD